MRYNTRFALMPIGKYRGIALGRIPADYLTWMLHQKWIYRNLAQSIEWELMRRAEEFLKAKALRAKVFA
jgi:uncharacterized protein (DUF3820 family)